MSTAKLIALPIPRIPPLCRSNGEPRRQPVNAESPQRLIVVDKPDEWPALAGPQRLVSAADYLSGAAQQAQPGSTIINLCRSYKYLSIGYYCSLLAEARGHLAYPSVKTINDLSRKAAYRLEADQLDLTLKHTLGARSGLPMPREFSIEIRFGVSDFAPLAQLARELFTAFPAPLLYVQFERAQHWRIRAIGLHAQPGASTWPGQLLVEALTRLDTPYIRASAAPQQPRLKLAILHDPAEALAPSNPAALASFIRVGRELDIDVSLIERKDMGRLAGFDALFIRTTTAIRHHTYLFAKKAASLGLVVIDDPVSILRCTNKIYLADLMRLNGIPTPRTFALRADQLDEIEALEQDIGYPMVLKVPDGAFSRGVSKVANRAEFEQGARALLKQSSLMLVQQYMYTEFDWRIGILDGQPIFACQYFMSQDHWQVAKRDQNGKAEFGMGRAVALDAVPPELLEYARRGAALIGTSLYGVDMKMTAGGPVLIEVNDNPNIDAGIEDGQSGDALYRTVLLALARRVDQQRQRAVSTPAAVPR